MLGLPEGCRTAAQRRALIRLLPRRGQGSGPKEGAYPTDRLLPRRGRTSAQKRIRLLPRRRQGSRPRTKVSAYLSAPPEGTRQQPKEERLSDCSRKGHDSGPKESAYRLLPEWGTGQQLSSKRERLSERFPKGVGQQPKSRALIDCSTKGGRSQDSSPEGERLPVCSPKRAGR